MLGELKIDKKRIIFAGLLSLVISSCLVYVEFVLDNPKSARAKFISLSIIIDQPRNFDKLASWLETLDFHNFTFPIDPSCQDYVLNNLTRLSILKDYGKLIPMLPVALCKNTLEERRAIVDSRIDLWEAKVGHSPKGFFHFMPDTYTVNYLKEKNVTFVQGYCFDQYVIDYMTQRGGWQMPYYAHPNHVLRPNTLHTKGVVIFPHLTWDWVASFTIDHHLSSHPLSPWMMYNRSEGKTVDFLCALVDRTINNCEPFGFASVQFEWSGIFLEKGLDNMITTFIDSLLSMRDYKFWSFEDITDWFRQNFDYTPAYKLDFISPASNEHIEWYYCMDFRVARVGGEVVSYVDYFEQEIDKYLTTCADFDGTLPPSILNSADNSLAFKIDALGGALNRHPITIGSITYTGKLEKFKEYYEGVR